MIKWKGFDPVSGEDVEFCCDQMKSMYGNLVHWDPAEKKWCIEVRRKSIQHNANTGKDVEIIEKDKLDMKVIDYCMFCGKNVYNDNEMRYNTTGSDWPRLWVRGVCGERPSFHTYICGQAPSMSGYVVPGIASGKVFTVVDKRTYDHIQDQNGQAPSMSHVVTGSSGYGLLTGVAFTYYHQDHPGVPLRATKYEDGWLLTGACGLGIQIKGEIRDNPKVFIMEHTCGSIF